MEIEMAGSAAIWPEAGLMRVVLLSVRGLGPRERQHQQRAVCRLMRAETRGVLYDARQVEDQILTAEIDLYMAGRWNGWGRVALIVRSDWTAIWKNLWIRWRSRSHEIKVFRDSDAARKWLTRTQINGLAS